MTDWREMDTETGGGATVGPTFAPLDPARDPARWEAMIRGIVKRAGPTLAAHRRRPGPVDLLASWLRPALAAAAVLAAIAIGVLAPTGEPAPARAAPGVSEVLGYPAPVAAWVEAGRRPSVEELVVAMEARSDPRAPESTPPSNVMEE
jgi:hypothetical protein